MSELSPTLVAVAPEHAAALLHFERANADYFAQFVPKRPLRMLTDKGMAAAIEKLCAEMQAGLGAYFVTLEDDEVVGRVNLTFDGEVADIGYRVAATHQGRGLASAMVKQAVEFLKENEFDVATAHALSSNPASIRVLEKCGFGINRVDQEAGAALGFDGDIVHFEMQLV